MNGRERFLSDPHSPTRKAHGSLPDAPAWAVRCLCFINQENPGEVKLCGLSVGSGCNPKLQEMEVRKVTRLGWGAE